MGALLQFIFPRFTAFEQFSPAALTNIAGINTIENKKNSNIFLVENNFAKKHPFKILWCSFFKWVFFLKSLVNCLNIGLYYFCFSGLIEVSGTDLSGKNASRPYFEGIAFD